MKPEDIKTINVSIRVTPEIHEQMRVAAFHAKSTPTGITRVGLMKELVRLNKKYNLEGEE